MAKLKLINPMQYEDPIDLLICQALDILEPSAEEQIIPALENIPELASELIPWENVVNSLGYDVPSLPMDSLKERLLQRISLEKIDLRTIETAKVSKKPEASHNLPRAISAWQKQAAQVTWQPHGEGITISPWDPYATPRETYWFVRLVPGAKFPCHEHARQEEIIMLEGDLTIEGQVYHPGDYIYSPPGTVHQPESTNGCLVLVRDFADDEILV